jgi:hypothetical protein
LEWIRKTSLRSDHGIRVLLGEGTRLLVGTWHISIARVRETLPHSIVAMNRNLPIDVNDLHCRRIEIEILMGHLESGPSAVLDRRRKGIATKHKDQQ